MIRIVHHRPNEVVQSRVYSNKCYRWCGLHYVSLNKQYSGLTYNILPRLDPKLKLSSVVLTKIIEDLRELQANIVDVGHHVAVFIAYLESASKVNKLKVAEISSQPDNVMTFGIIHLNGIQDFYDSLPQAYTNKIMRHVAETLKYQLRGNDIVGRWAPLEFAIFLPSTDGASAEGRMMRIRDVLDQPFSLDSDDDTAVLLDLRIGLADRQGGESLALVIEAKREVEPGDIAVSLQGM